MNATIAAARSFVFSIGRANRPLGLDEVEIFSDDRLAYRRTVDDKVILQVTGRCEPQTFSNFIGYLAQTGYPAEAQEMFLPGGAQIAVGLDGRDKLVYLDRGGAGKQPGYKNICEEMIRLTDAFRLGDLTLLPAWLLTNSMQEWKVVGRDTFSGDEYLISRHATQSDAEAAAGKALAQILTDQPTGQSGGDTGVQDHIYIEDNYGQRRRYLTAG